jgi:acylphosphatase
VADGKLERRTVHYAGRVQGVGFRYMTTSIAQRFAVKGFVQNLSDGRVRLVAEGTVSELNAFLSAIDDAMSLNIRERQVDTTAASGQFTSFSTRATE